jgi:hypothetical protein
MPTAAQDKQYAAFVRQDNCGLNGLGPYRIAHVRQPRLQYDPRSPSSAQAAQSRAALCELGREQAV